MAFLLQKLAIDFDTEALEVMGENLTNAIDELGGMSFSQMMDTFGAFLLRSLPQLLKAILTCGIGCLVVLVLLRLTRRFLGKVPIDPTLHSFIFSTIKILLIGFLAIFMLGILNVNLTPMVAAIGALGLALSLSLQDTLSNVAGGISMLFSRPFAKGDYIEISGMMGTVMELGLIYTQMLTVDNKKIFLSNGDVAKNSIINYSAEPMRRLDLTFNIRDSSDYKYVKKMMLEEIDRAPLALKDPAPIIRISDQTYRYIQMTAYVWGKTPDLLELKNYLIGEIRRRISDEGL